MLHKNRLALLGVILATTTFVLAAMVNRDRNSPRPGILVENGGKDHRTPTTKSSEQPRKPAADSKQKQDLVISPNTRFIVYHGSFDPYSSSHEPLLFTVADANTGLPLRSIPVQWSARYVSSVNWIDDRYIVVHGEGGFLAILDVEANRQTHNLIGSNFSLSPNETQIVYSYDFNPRYGEIPPEYQSDYVLFSLIERPSPSGQIQDRYESSNYKVIYPDPLAWGEVERKPHDDLTERHQIKSPFAWKPDGRNVAFVETYQQKLWLVVLQLDMSNSDVAASSRKFELGTVGDNSTLALTWMPIKNQIRVRNDQASWLVNLDTSVIRPIP